MVLVVLVTTGLTVRFRVAILSQPAALVRVSVYEPAEVILRPFQLYGSWLAQMVVVVVLVTTGLTFKFRVAILSQPAVLVRVSVYEPAEA